MAKDDSAVLLSDPDLEGRAVTAEATRPSDGLATSGAELAAEPPGSPDIELLVPADDTVDPEVSIVIPAVNEELCISDFVQWCHEGLRKAGARGEILIVDSSTDRTAESRWPVALEC